jgi:hypothetical protein
VVRVLGGRRPAVHCRRAAGGAAAIHGREHFRDQGSRGIGIVRELGFANLSTGTLGLASLAVPAWVVPAAIVGGLFYGLAALGHAFRGKRNFKEQTALISDIFAFVILAVFVASTGF